MGLRPALGGVVVASADRTAGTVTSGPIAVAGGATFVVAHAHASAISGSPTLDVTLEESADGDSWSAIAGGAATQLTAAGNRTVCGLVTENFVQVKAVLAGTSTPHVTYSLAAVVY